MVKHNDEDWALSQRKPKFAPVLFSLGNYRGAGEVWRTACGSAASQR